MKSRLVKRSFDKVIVTGVSGSGGSYLAERILNKYPNCELVGISRSRTSSSNANLKNIEKKIKVENCDLRDSHNLFRILNEVKPDIIFNVASQANVLDSFHNVNSNSLNNVELILNLLECIRNLSLNPLILHCSTSEVYGKVAESDLPITEKQPFSPSSPYSVSKIYQDYLCDVYSNSFGLNIIKTRMFTYINPKRSDLFASSFAKQIAEIELGQRGILRHGNLDSIRTILDVRDAMDAYIACAEMCEIGDVYNIGGDTVVTVGDVLQKLISYAKKNIETEIDQNLLRPIDVTLQVPNDKKFRKITGWTPRYTLDETLLELLDFWRAKVRAIEN